MYLEHYGLTTYPFSLTPDTLFFHDFAPHQEALNTILFGIQTGEGFIKITGEVGTGKTLLCRKVLSLLSPNEYITAYIPNPHVTPLCLQKMLAEELGIFCAKAEEETELLNKIYHELITLASQKKRVILIIDEAQSLTNEGLESLRLLSNFETESKKLLQIILCGQPELNKRLKQYQFRQLSQRITFSHTLYPLKREEVFDYIYFRLNTAGQIEKLFKTKAIDLLYKASKGIPRLINILAHKAMLSAYGKKLNHIDEFAVSDAIEDSQEIVDIRRYVIKDYALTGSVAGGLILLDILYLQHLGFLSFFLNIT